MLQGRWARLGQSTEGFNRQHNLQDRERSLPDSLERLHQARQMLLALLETVTDDQLLNEYGRQQVGWWAKWNTSYSTKEPS